jgi:hypothetical protein
MHWILIYGVIREMKEECHFPREGDYHAAWDHLGSTRFDQETETGAEKRPGRPEPLLGSFHGRQGRAEALFRTGYTGGITCGRAQA